MPGCLEATLTALVVAQPPAKDLLVHTREEEAKRGRSLGSPTSTQALALRLKSRCED